ncbi:helicase-related protein [Bacillus sp. 31A1R]|uniref:Helicase-related protein n=1 Tax=Robertmurraya mangrovi TaxID=3098077 RepID=A0ABU5J388_9BACI|nr:helicase-related protein [Bacillus sp. 31A1R]MDZ5473874.1 helicase-related protein [Bacillus sp. 31A1R]
MTPFGEIYENAVEHTKRKLYEDVFFYLGNKEVMPTFEQYLSDRQEYIEQLWINIWLNKATNNVSRNEKKNYLRERGFEVDGVDRKVINHLFRTEIRHFQPFDMVSWLKNSPLNDREEWEDRYHNAREVTLQKEEENRLEEQRRKLQMSIESAANDIVVRNQEYFYLNIRYAVATQLAKGFANNVKYKSVDTFALEEKLVQLGQFDPDSYTTLSNFLTELTGEIHRTVYLGRRYFEYETYTFVYERLIANSLFDIVPTKLVEELEKEGHKNLSKDMIKNVVAYHITTLQHDFMKKIQEEYVSDLIKLADTTFDYHKHREIYLDDLEDRKRKIAEELAELQRKKEEEERILEDIFGREYSYYLGRTKKYILHIGETNTGKTHHALERMKQANSGLYLAPLRLLALEVYDKLNQEGTPCSLKTGEEEKINSEATHISCTVEMFHEKEFYDVVVIDEAQMITDKDRGFSWYKAITKANANEVHIIGSRNAKGMMLELLGDSDVTVHHYKRDIPLEVESKPFQISQTKKGDALICFSRRRVLETASRLQNEGYSVSMIYGSMPPETRKKQIERFINGETTVIVSTDAIGMGLNLPIRRIVFLENDKFDGSRRRLLTSQEVKQIAGRAGRKGIYNVGKVAFTSQIKVMKKLLQQEDEPVYNFAIAPTNAVFERFQKYYRDLGTFFELWDQFESPPGTKKASLSEEKELYELVQGTEIEAHLSIMDLYGFLHLPFSKKESELTQQWFETMQAIINGRELPEPVIKKGTLEALELTYKSLGLHLLFLYRLDRRTEVIYWERLRDEISDLVHERLGTDVKKMTKKCRKCRRSLPWDSDYQICDACYASRYRRF